MRSVIPIETVATASEIDEILAKHDWMLDIDGIDNGQDRSNSWKQRVAAATPQRIVHDQEAALTSQLAASNEMKHEVLVDSGQVQNALRQQELAIDAQSRAITAELQALSMDHTSGNSRHPYGQPFIASTLADKAAREANEIMAIIAAEDLEIAWIEFQYPIFDRQTQTFGTVHYEVSKHFITIRLKNPQPEKLKMATERIIYSLIEGETEPSTKVRLAHVATRFRSLLRAVWYRDSHRRRDPIAFGRIRVLEQGNSNEAFSGVVRPEQTLESVIRERRGDLLIASTFLFLALLIFILSSPWVWNLDYATHAERWTNGWLAWFAGNLSRIGSALMVGVFLPVISVWLAWRHVRRKPIVNWNTGVAELHLH